MQVRWSYELLTFFGHRYDGRRHERLGTGRQWPTVIWNKSLLHCDWLSPGARRHGAPSLAALSALIYIRGQAHHLCIISLRWKKYFYSIIQIALSVFLSVWLDFTLVLLLILTFLNVIINNIILKMRTDLIPNHLRWKKTKLFLFL